MLPISENPPADGSESIELSSPEYPSRPPLPFPPNWDDLSQTDSKSMTSTEEEPEHRYPSSISMAPSCGSESESPAPSGGPECIELPLPEFLTVRQQTRKKTASVRLMHIGEAGYKGGVIDKLKRTKKQYFFEVTNHHKNSPVLVIICREATLRPAHRIVEKGVSLSSNGGGKGA